MKNNKKTGRDDGSRAARKDPHSLDVTPIRLRSAAAIGRAALRGQLPVTVVERLIGLTGGAR